VRWGTKDKDEKSVTTIKESEGDMGGKSKNSIKMGKIKKRDMSQH